MEPLCNEVFGTMRNYLGVWFLIVSGWKSKEIWRVGASEVALLWEGFVVSNIFMTRFDCNYFCVEIFHSCVKLLISGELIIFITKL